MPLSRPPIALSAAGLALAAGLTLAVPAQAQTTTTRTETVASGKVVRLVISPNLKKDCSTGATPEIRIATAPKNGQLQTRGGKIKTPASYRCPDKEAQAQAVFYRSKPGFTGSDQAVIEIKTADGTIEKQDIRITVEAAKVEDKKADEKKADDKKADEKKTGDDKDKGLSDL